MVMVTSVIIIFTDGLASNDQPYTDHDDDNHGDHDHDHDDVKVLDDHDDDEKVFDDHNDDNHGDHDHDDDKVLDKPVSLIEGDAHVRLNLWH